MRPVDEPLTDLALELLGVAYMQTVVRHADAAWRAGRGDQFLTVLTRTCDAYRIEPVSDNLVQRLGAAYDDPYDRYLLVVSVGASALWEHDHAFALLATLRAWTTTANASPIHRAARGDGAVQRLPLRRACAIIPLRVTGRRKPGPGKP